MSLNNNENMVNHGSNTNSERVMRISVQNNIFHHHDDLDDVEPEVILVKTSKSDEELKAIFQSVMKSWMAKPNALWGELSDVLAERVGTVVNESDLSIQ
jgi:hypothetical protein